MLIIKLVGSEHRGGGVKVYTLIIAEDDYQIRNGLSQFFPWQQLGFELTGSFENGKQALLHALANDTEVILTDIRMPVMDGLMLAEALKREGSKACIVAMSAYRDFDYAHRALNLGIRYYMVKSTHYDELIDIFTKLKADLDKRAGTDAAPPPQGIDSADAVVRKIICHVRENLANASLNTAAADVGFSPVYLSQYFKDKSGVHFMDFLIRVKMEQAAAMLRDERVKLWQISSAVGYSNEKNFSRAFKKYFGYSPNEYRKLG